jgi:hypothetical protein
MQPLEARKLLSTSALLGSVSNSVLDGGGDNLTFSQNAPASIVPLATNPAYGGRYVGNINKLYINGGKLPHGSSTFQRMIPISITVKPGTKRITGTVDWAKNWVGIANHDVKDVPLSGKYNGGRTFKLVGEASYEWVPGVPQYTDRLYVSVQATMTADGRKISFGIKVIEEKLAATGTWYAEATTKRTKG